MKKTLAILMTLAMVLSLFAGLTLNSSAHNLKYVEKEYKYAEALTNYGVGIEDGAIKGETIFEDRWAYEYLDLTGDKGVFKPMGCWQSSPIDGANHKWANIYTTTTTAVLDGTDPYNYCCFGNTGVRIHPGLKTSPVLAFIVPVSGEINLDAAIGGYGSGNTREKKPVSYGCIIEVWVNDAKVWPAADAPEQRAWYTGDEGTCTIDIDNLKVKEGDYVRISATVAKNEEGNPDKGGKGMDFTTMPVVTYVKTDDGTPIGDPNGTPPASVKTSDRTSDGFTVSWEKADTAVSYNIYTYTDDASKAVKMNSAPVTELTFNVTGLESSTTYYVYVTTVTAAGGESLPSDAMTVKTRAGETTSTDTSSDVASSETDTSAPSDTSAAPSNTDTTEEPKAGFPIWIVIVAAVAVVAVIVVVIVLGKKKK